MTDIACIQKNAREELRVSLENFRGHDIANLRVWYCADDGEMRPGKQGVALRRDLLPDLIEALKQADAACQEVS